jgi:L-ascorbate metabolism protein UlaG (beta-lactamase superfamily)
MDLTKYGHACVVLSKDGRRLVIDPGAFTEDGVIGDAEAVLVTHEHPDHLSVEALDAAWAQNPGLRVWTTAAVAEVLGDRDVGSRLSPTARRSPRPASTSPLSASGTR